MAGMGRASGVRNGLRNGAGAAATEEMSDLRLALSARQQLRAAMAKELCLGAEQVRWLREEAERAEGDLRVWARALGARADELAQTAERMEAIRASAERACGQLAALARENDGLTHELASLGDMTARLERSVGGEEGAGEIALDTFAGAAGTLARELTRASEGQAVMGDRVHGLMEEAAAVRERARSLQRCLQLSQQEMAHLRAQIARILGAGDGAGDWASDGAVATGRASGRERVA